VRARARGCKNPSLVVELMKNTDRPEGRAGTGSGSDEADALSRSGNR